MSRKCEMFSTLGATGGQKNNDGVTLWHCKQFNFTIMLVAVVNCCISGYNSRNQDTMLGWKDIVIPFIHLFSTNDKRRIERKKTDTWADYVASSLLLKIHLWFLHQQHKIQSSTFKYRGKQPHMNSKMVFTSPDE
jgi:hypothetical protein